jgi:hypothetical protein
VHRRPSGEKSATQRPINLALEPSPGFRVIEQSRQLTRVNELADELADALAATDGPRQALTWPATATGTTATGVRRRGLPTSLRSPVRAVVLGRNPWSREQVLDALRQSTCAP